MTSAEAKKVRWLIETAVALAHLMERDFPRRGPHRLAAVKMFWDYYDPDIKKWRGEAKALGIDVSSVSL